MSLTELLAQGKVRDIYEAGDDLLMVATDRISAFDVVLTDPIPDKGRVLNGLSLHWFALTGHLIGKHLITAEASAFPEACADRGAELAGRAMLVKRAEMVPIEC